MYIYKHVYINIYIHSQIKGEPPVPASNALNPALSNSCIQLCTRICAFV